MTSDDFSIVGFIMIVIAVFAVVLVLLAYGNIEGGAWNIVAQGVASFVVFIAVFAFVAYVIARQLKN